MSYEFGDRSESKSRAARIREAFVAGTTVNAHAEYCLNTLKLWTESEVRGMASIQARAEVREALGVITADGVPFAGPTPAREGRTPIWKQMEFWSKVDFDYNYSAYKRREVANGRIAANIAHVCLNRFGAPPILIDIEDDPES